MKGLDTKEALLCVIAIILAVEFEQYITAWILLAGMILGLTNNILKPKKSTKRTVHRR